MADMEKTFVAMPVPALAYTPATPDPKNTLELEEKVSSDTAAKTVDSPGPPEHTEIKVEDDGDVITHDPALSRNASALLDFLAMHAASPPNYYLACKGTHTETTRRKRRNADGSTEYVTQTRTVTDFEFTLPLRLPDDDLKGSIFIVPDELPAWRGVGHTRRAGTTAKGDTEKGAGQTGTRKLEREEKKALDARCSWLEERGFPLSAPWNELDDAAARTKYGDEEDVRRWDKGLLPPQVNSPPFSSVFLGRLVDFDAGDRARQSQRIYDSREEARRWCEGYTANSSPLKEFRMVKSLDSFDFTRVEVAIKQEIEKAGYQNTIHLDWQKTSSEVRVMPDNRIARLFSLHIGWRILLSLVLVYPILWLLRWAFFGARYQVIRSSASLSRWVPYGATQASELDALGRTRQRAMLPTPSGQMQDFVLVGMTEEEWIAASRQRLQQAVWRGIGRSIPMRNLAMDGF